MFWYQPNSQTYDDDYNIISPPEGLDYSDEFIANHALFFFDF